MLHKLWRKVPFRIRTAPTVRRLIRLILKAKFIGLQFNFIQKTRSKKHIASKFQFKSVILAWPTYDWNIPLKQRPQHIAEAFSRIKGFAYIFATRNAYDNLKSVRFLHENLAITPLFWQLLKQVDYIHVYANDPNFTLQDFKRIEKFAIPVIYEILDEFDVALQGGNSIEILARHNYVLRSKILLKVVVTSSVLKSALSRAGYPENKMILSPNACDTKHFLLNEVPDHKEPVVGYFGALASWFDYELLRKLASENPNFKFKLIGMDYDGSLFESKVLEMPNIDYLGTIPYSILPQFVDFDVAIVPFKINAITLATSPIKVYEYLACGIPVVSTRLPECEKIEFIQIADTANDFSKEIKSAISADSFTARLARRKYAMTQSWDARAVDISNSLEMRAERI